MIEKAAGEVFAELGYRGASMSEIARRSGVTVPVLYDHFSSKLDLHRRLLEQTRDGLLEMWRAHLVGDEPPEVRFPRAIDAWARYVEENPYAARVYFRGSAGDPEAEAVHREVVAPGQAALGLILAEQPGAEHLSGGTDALAYEMAAEVLRSALTGLAVWWSEHPHVPREQIVRTAVNAVWFGFDRVRRGEGWTG